MALIPTNNPASLIGYYLGIASIIPFLNCLTAIPAIVCGIIGIIKAKQNPAAGGMGHSIAAICLGLFGPLIFMVIWSVMAGGFAMITG